MAFRNTPQLGPSLEAVILPGQVWYDIPGKGTIISPQLGTKEWGSDGRAYILVVAGGDIAAEAQVAIDDETFEATSGGTGSGYYNQGEDVVEGAFFWARKGDI